MLLISLVVYIVAGLLGKFVIYRNMIRPSHWLSHIHATVSTDVSSRTKRIHIKAVSRDTTHKLKVRLYTP